MSHQLPGMTENFGNPFQSVMPFINASKLVGLKDRKVVLLATATITQKNIFSNGLFQNVYIIYKMFDAMGYAPILVINEKPETLDSVPSMMCAARMMTTDEIIRQPLPVVALIEIGMSIDPLLRQFVKMLGGRLAKLYLGNILNIDIETPIFYPGMFFTHHVIEKIDTIWVSPHYGQHAEYASFLNHVTPPSDLTRMIAPYVWDPCFLTRDYTEFPRWKPRAAPEDDVIVIMEPNISFQKCCFVPLMAIERWYRNGNRSWKGKVIVVNGDRVTDTTHFKNTIAPYLDICKDGLVTCKDRMDILSVMKEYPSALFMMHQVNNEYNYMTMELMWCGFPAVHNTDAWGQFGYSYTGNNIDLAAKQLEIAYSGHTNRLEAYKANANILTWQHSPYNPANQLAWDNLIHARG
uniref:Glycosyltransferase n=1 Tax=viral metagenome TaxID=1070528 RepID=A0A6C0DBU3_9ZZZZ